MRSYRRTFSKCGTHGCAECVQISAVGWNHEVSSIVPAFRKATSGIDSMVLYIGDPQVEQKRRSVVLWKPSLTVLNEASVLPCTMSALLGTPTTTENAEAVWRWQFEQWQTPCQTGSASTL
jgi:hypothetical protein